MFHIDVPFSQPARLLGKRTRPPFLSASRLQKEENVTFFISYIIFFFTQTNCMHLKWEIRILLGLRWLGSPRSELSHHCNSSLAGFLNSSC